MTAFPRPERRLREFNSGARRYTRMARGTESAGCRSRILAFEFLESRSLLAGDLDLTPTPTVEPDGATIESTAAEAVVARVEFTLQLTQPDGSPLTSLAAGDDFVLHVFVKDLRESARGVFAAFLDVIWDPTKAELTGPLQYGADYPNALHADSSTPGALDEVGALADLVPVGGERLELFTVPLRALGAGTLEFIAGPADVRPVRDVVVYDDSPGNPIVSDEETIFGSVSITVNEAVPIVPDDTTVQAPESGNELDTVPAADEPNVAADEVVTLAAADATPDSSEPTLNGVVSVFALLLAADEGRPAAMSSADAVSPVLYLDSDSPSLRVAAQEQAHIGGASGDTSTGESSDSPSPSAEAAETTALDWLAISDQSQQEKAKLASS